MRKFLLTLTTLCIALFTQAQEDNTGEYMYIFRGNSTIERILVADIDSITFVNPFASDTPDSPSSTLESGCVYLGLLGFNQQLYSYPVSLLTEENKEDFDSFIDDLKMKNGTLLYYSVDHAINALQSAELPADLSTAAIVTFTDGLDQGSMMMNSSYSDNAEYLAALSNRIKNETIGGCPITAYSIGLRGSDVSDITTFRNNLSQLASSSDNATEVTSMSEVNAKFKEIAGQLSQSNYFQTINLTIPGVSNGTVIRFTLDNATSANNSTLYIEGTFNLSTRSLENVKYSGLTSSSGISVKGVVDGIFVSFTFEEVHTGDNTLIDQQAVDEWTYISSNGTWQMNSEFDKTENTDIVTERSSAVIMLVLDCSSSLADDFVTAQDNAKDFINTLCEAVLEDYEPAGKVVDLGLSVKWAGWNVGASSPEEYGDYYAWGETSTKSDYSWSTYKWYNGSDGTVTKYCTNSDYGTVDNRTTLEPSDDVAHVKWGGSWRMPTSDEIKELKEKCKWQWTTYKGVNGYKVTGPNGNSIFLPAAGYRSGSGVYSRGSNGYYWSSSLYSSYSSYAYYLFFNSSYYGWSYSSRYDGHSVRPVSE